MYKHFKGQSGFAKKSDKRPPFAPPGQSITPNRNNFAASNELSKNKKDNLKRK